MNGTFLTSYFALWAVVCCLFVVTWALARQIGMLHTRLGQSGARMENAGPAVGDPAPGIDLPDLEGNEIRLAELPARNTLLVFISASCPSCSDLAPALRSLESEERSKLRVLLTSFNGDPTTNRAFVEKARLNHLPFILSQTLAARYGVFTAPYAILVDLDGRVRAKGLVNHREHLDSLLNALDIGHESLQAFLDARAARASIPPAATPNTQEVPR